MEHSSESEKLTTEVLEVVNVGAMLHLPVHAIRNLIEGFGHDRIKAYLRESRGEDERAKQVKEGLRSCIACYSDEVSGAFFEINPAISPRHLLRAIKLQPTISEGLMDIMLGRASDEEVLDLASKIAELTQIENRREKPTTPGKPRKSALQQEPSHEREEIAVYGHSGALNFEICKSRRGDLALNVDAAVSAGVRTYDWRRKIIVQLSEREMLMLYAVLRGLLKTFNVKSHGAANQKALSVENQGSNFYARVQERGRPIVAVPILPSDAAMVLMLIGNAIVRKQPVLGSLEGVDGLVRPLVQMIEQSAQKKAA